MMNGQILVTGAAGFLGANLVRRLLDLNFQVTGIDNLRSGNRRTIELLAGSHLNFHELDIRDKDAVWEVSEGAGTIIHLAELKIPRYNGTMETLEANVNGVEVMLDIAARRGARFILGSTDEIYGKNPEEPLNEESALVLGQTNVSRWSLAVSKLMAEQLTFAYRDEYDLPVTIVRYGTGYGRHQALDWHGGPIPIFIGAALQRQPLPIHGDGLQTRTFGHVDDLVAGTVLALSSEYATGEILNIAGNETISVINLAYLVWRLTGNHEKPKLEFIPYSDFSRNYEDVRRRIPDISKALYLLGYQPRISLHEGLLDTIEWQRSTLNHNSLESLHAVTVDGVAR